MDPMVEASLPVDPSSSLPPCTLSTHPQHPVSSSAVGGDDSGATAIAMTTTTVQDSTADFLSIFRDLSFASLAELEAKMEEFQLSTGNRYVKTNTRRLPSDSPGAETLVYSHLVYICYRYGNQVSEAKHRRLQR